MATALVACGAIAGCAGGGPGTVVSGDRALAADPATMGLSPSTSGRVLFVLTSGGAPVAGQIVTFDFTDRVEAQGATLDPPSAVTDVSGTAAVTVTAGTETQFFVRGRSGLAQAEAEIIVAAGDVGSVVAVPFLVPSSRAAGSRNEITQIELSFFDGNTCATRPAKPTRRTELTSLASGVRAMPFDFVRTDQTSAVVGRAVDAESEVIAAGCVDVPGSSLLPGGVVEVALPLDDAVPDPVGSFEITSRFAFSPPLAAAAVVAAPWRDLADCPLDPVQLWLDCTIDALSPAAAGDPLDCVPASAPGGEGTLGDALAARRGVLIVDGGGVATACRGPRDAGGAVSLDAILLGLYGTPLPPALTSLPAIANDAAHILDGMTLKSTLTVSAGRAASSYVVTHTLASAAFGPTKAKTEALLAPLALPVLTAYTTASTRDGPLVIGRHGFTLRLGTAARAAFSTLALEPRGLPGETAGLVDALAGLARSDDGASTGCDAMDGALCPLVGGPPGCLMAACTAGLGALAARLDAGFRAADGTGLDLYLAGSTPLLDLRGSGFADHLGSGNDQIAIWSADLHTSLELSTLTVSFDGSRCADAACLGGP